MIGQRPFIDRIQAYFAVCPAQSTPRPFCDVALHLRPRHLRPQPGNFRLLRRHQRPRLSIRRHAQLTFGIRPHPVRQAGLGHAQCFGHHRCRTMPTRRIRLPPLAERRLNQWVKALSGCRRSQAQASSTSSVRARLLPALLMPCSWHWRESWRSPCGAICSTARSRPGPRSSRLLPEIPSSLIPTHAARHRAQRCLGVGQGGVRLAALHQPARVGRLPGAGTHSVRQAAARSWGWPGARSSAGWDTEGAADMTCLRP